MSDADFPRSLLIVEDDEALRDRLARAFRDRGYEVRQAADAEESAVAAARAEATEYTSDATPVEGSLASDEALQALRNKLTSGS